jgi:plasmid stabilization system protein ParE
MARVLRTDAAEESRLDIWLHIASDNIAIYRPLPDGIEVMLVIHGARDIPTHFWNLFGGE